MQDGRIAIGRRIKRFRELRGLSRQQIADQLLVDLTAAAAWEAGKYLPREGRRVRLAELLACDVGTLFAEEQEPSLGDGVALVDPLIELPGLLRELIGRVRTELKVFRLAAPAPSRPFLQEEFRRILDRRLSDGSIAVARIEVFHDLGRFREVMSNLGRYRGKNYRVRAFINGSSTVVPAMGGYMFDDEEFLLGTYWQDPPDDGVQDLRMSGEPFRRYFLKYWEKVWPAAEPLNPDGIIDLEACRTVASSLGLSKEAWPDFVAGCKDVILDDGLPPAA